jgi:hypothetical protein
VRASRTRVGAGRGRAVSDGGARHGGSQRARQGRACRSQGAESSAFHPTGVSTAHC